MFSKLFLLFSCLALTTCLPPTNVLIIESSVCGRCKYFNSLIPRLLSITEFDKLVDWSVIQPVHLREQKNKDNTYTYTHAFGDEFLLKAKVQHCVNKLYSNLISLKWAAHEATNKSKLTLQELVKEFFKEDSGVAVLKCANGPKGNEYTREAMLTYSQLRFAGMLPFVVLNKSKDGLIANHNFDIKNIIKTICNNRPDKEELKACKENSGSLEFLKYLDTEYDFPNEVAEKENTEIDFSIQEEIENDGNNVVDYEKFWNTYDD